MPDNKFIAWIYKWLPIIMGCHCKPERSFCIKGRPFPICARCTGMLVGFILAIFLYPIYRPNCFWLVLMMLPGILDGLRQMKSSYESNNYRRLFTGLLMGFGLMSLIVWSFAFTYRIGWNIGKRLF